MRNGRLFFRLVVLSYYGICAQRRKGILFQVKPEKAAQDAAAHWEGTVNGMRLGDLDALMDEFRRYMVDRYDRGKCVSEENCKTCDKGCLWRKIINSAPTIDAVTVVRCEDCKYFRRNLENDTYCACVWGLSDPEEHDFCSYGERKDGEG